MGYFTKDSSSVACLPACALKPAPPRIDFVESGYRFYSPELGRWISRDPIGEEAFRAHHELGSGPWSAAGTKDDKSLVSEVLYDIHLTGGHVMQLTSTDPVRWGVLDKHDVIQILRPELRQVVYAVRPVHLVFVGGHKERFSVWQQAAFHAGSRWDKLIGLVERSVSEYRFVANSPLTLIDILGLIMSCEVCFCPIGGPVNPEDDCAEWTPATCGMQSCMHQGQYTKCGRLSLN